MKSAIRQMLNGDRGNFQDIKATNEFNKLLEKAVAQEEALLAKLAESPESLELYKKVDHSIHALNCESETSYYVEGFKFGFLFGLEIAKD